MRTIILLFLSLSIIFSIASYSGKKVNVHQLTDQAVKLKGQTTDVIYKSSDGGKTWQDISLGLPEKMGVRCIYTQGAEVYLAEDIGGVYHSCDPSMGLWEHEDVGGYFWNFGGILPSEKVNGIFPGRFGPYATLRDGGLYRKISDSKLWQPLYQGPDSKVIYSVLENHDGSLLVSSPMGIYKSKDNCKSWKQVCNKLGIYNIVNSNGVLIASGVNGLLRSIDGGDHWDWSFKDEDDFYNVSVIKDRIAALCVAHKNKSDPGFITLRTSNDGGKNWQAMDKNLMPLQGVDEIEQIGEYLLCSNKDGVFRSKDGKKWDIVSPKIGKGEMVRYKLAVSGNSVYFVIMRGGC